MATLQVPITKGEATVAVDIDQIPEALFQYAVALGLKTILNRGMSKITKTTADKLRLAMEAAEKNLQALYEGKVRMTGGVKVKEAKGEINTEALRLAKLAVKDSIKEAGQKISHYDAKEITIAAKELIAQDATYVEQAKANIEARKSVKPKVGIDVSKIAVSAKRVADAEQKKKDDKIKRDAKKECKPLSAKQAGKVAPRAKAQKAQATRVT